MSATLLDGLFIAKQIHEEIEFEINAIKKKHLFFEPSLAVFLVGNDPASHLYVKKKQEACKRVGIKSYIYETKENISQVELINSIEMCPQDAIIVQLPLPKHLDRFTVLDAIDPVKDVDCLTAINTGLVAQGCPRF